VTACLRGCVIDRRHLDECDTNTCRGCLPRRAADDRLICLSCHRRLQMMITDAPDIDRWLAANTAAGGQQRIRQDWERSSSDTSVRTEAFVDQRYVLSDLISAMTDWTCEAFDLDGPRDMTMPVMSNFLLAWLTKIETRDWVAHWWNELAEVILDCHSLAPWQPELRRCTGIECPECHTQSLVVYGGDESVTCQNCRLVIPASRYAIWTRMLAEENGIEDAS
jgi:hypothetical protein